ncbi:MAG: hypothetical protein JST87_18620 [Bacteroidetes bacterium]|nr:hypothetical protein [Bacteroidota bacterium]
MKKNTCLYIFIILICSCKIQPGSNRNNASADKLFKLNIKPASGSDYYYDISNNSTVEIEVNEKKIETQNKTNVGINYKINTDSLGHFIVSLQYKKIHVYSKNANGESDIDAADSSTASDPTSKMLGLLTSSVITAIVNNSGEVIKIDGYRDVMNKTLSETVTLDLQTKEAMQKQWQQLVEQKLVKKNVDQLFRIFPDSAVHIGDKWKIISKETGDIGYLSKNFFTLESISDGIAKIESDGEITSDSVKTNYMNYEVMSNLNGTQKGEYEVDIKTGMLVNCSVEVGIKGVLEMMGKEIPINVSSDVKMKGKKNN